MLKNFLKLTWRNLWRHKGFSLINILGLTVGMACAVLVWIWVKDEFSYDRFHENTNELFCVYNISHSPDGEDEFYTVNPIALGPHLEANYPEVLNSTRFFEQPFSLGNGEKHYTVSVVLVDASFFEMFSFPLIEGDPESVLVHPYSIVLSERAAKKYFGDKDPLGKTLLVNNSFDVTVSGIAEDVPANSHIQFDYLMPILVFKEAFKFDMDDWGNFSFRTYIQLAKNVPYRSVEQKISGLIKEHYPESEKTLHLQPLSKIHLHALGGGGQILYIYVISALIGFIMLMACINYMNLSTARSVHRAREIGIRQIVGAKRKDLIIQFLGEAVFISFIAMLASLILVYLLLPYFNKIMGKPLMLSISTDFLLILLATALLTGIVAGSYPSFFLSSLKMMVSIKKKISVRGKESLFRRFLVVVQFGFAIFFIIVTIGMYRQLKYIQTKDLGFNKDNIVCMRMDSELVRKYYPFKNRLLENPYILNVACSNTTPDVRQSSYSGNLVRWEGMAGNSDLTILHWLGVDFGFLGAYQLEMAQGRFFSIDFGTDWDESVVLNETAVKAMGMESPLGKKLYLGDDSAFTIIGVVKDFHFQSLHHKIEPLAMKMGWALSQISIRIAPHHIPETLRFIDNTLKDVIPGQPFDYEFFNARLEQQYKEEQTLESLLKFMAGLSIFISCLGLLGLVAFSLAQRTKEIGIRKVLGCSVPGIAALLSKDMIKWILIANLFAWPVSYYALNKWMHNFYYRSRVDLWIFIVSGAITLTLAMLTICYKSIKAATTNPVDSLRNE